MASLQSIKELKKSLEVAAEKDPVATVSILDQLSKLEINVSILKETKIGKSVGKLRKHSDDKVAKASKSLVSKWKAVVEAPSSSQSVEEPVKPPPESKKREREPEQEIQTKKPKPAPPKKKDSGPDDSRDKIVDLIKQCLGEKQPEDILEPAQVAKEIEEAMFAKYKEVNRDYKTKYRSLSFNLKNPKNPVLRNQVLAGEILPQALIEMTPQQMASEELKKERERLSNWHLEAAKLGQGNQTTTDMFKCGKCGKRETTYYQMQTRSADEPMTTFHTCTNCGSRWKS